jgi:phosphatidylglycerol:prolipoprotein diacylglycerol transferase
VLLFSILWVLRTRVKLPRGVITGAFFILYALLRIIGEIFREPDPAWKMGVLSAGQSLSLFMPLLGVAFIVWGFRTRQYEAAFTSPAPAKTP